MREKRKVCFTGYLCEIELFDGGQAVPLLPYLF